MSDKVPTLSIGLPVRNGLEGIGKCIESVLSQDFTDLELVICDNASDDGTIELLKRYAEADPRVRVHLNPVNIGLHDNVQRVAELSRGRLFRWISADDWLEPQCLSKCVAALEKRPDAVGVTTWFTIHMEDGTTRFEEFAGPYPDSPDRVERFSRMLWFFFAGDAKFDPVYSMYRRDALMACRPLRPSERTDWLLSAELALRGPILVIKERLSNRTRDYPKSRDRAKFRRVLDPKRGEEIRTSARRMHRQFLAMAVSADLSEAELRRCRPALRTFWRKEAYRMFRQRVTDTLHDLIGRWRGRGVG